MLYKTGTLTNAAAFVIEGGRLGLAALTRATLPTVTNNSPLVLRTGATLYAINNTTNGIHLLNTVTVDGVVTNEYQTHTLSFSYLGDVRGTGTVVNYLNGSINTVSNRFLGSISPGFGPGTLTFDEATGVTILGEPGMPVMLNIEDGDTLVLTNMGAAVDLANIDVTFLTATAKGTTNWFLYADNGFINDFNSINYGILTGELVYEANRIGAVVVPEPCIALVGLAGLLWSRRR